MCDGGAQPYGQGASSVTVMRADAGVDTDAMGAAGPIAHARRLARRAFISDVIASDERDIVAPERGEQSQALKWNDRLSRNSHVVHLTLCPASVCPCSTDASGSQ